MWVYQLPFGARLVIEVDCKQAVALIELRSKTMRNVRPVLEFAAKILRESFGDQFAAGGKPGWKALAPSTIAAKMAAGLPPSGKRGKPLRRLLQKGNTGGAQILIGTGGLRDSYRQKGASGHIERYSEDSVEVGSSLKIAGYHQKGTSPYVIRARFKKALAFIGGQGESILRRSVQHPGLPARPVLAQPEDAAAIADAFRRHLRGEHIATAA